MQPSRVAQRRLEEMKLLPRRPRNRRLQGNGYDWIFRAKILEMRLQEAELLRKGPAAAVVSALMPTSPDGVRLQ